MLKKIFGTVGAKLFHAILSLVIVFINANNLGSEGIGTIALIVLGVTIILLINNFVGGSAIVYLIPKYNFLSILAVSYSWAIVASIGGASALAYFSLIPETFFIQVLLLGLIHSFGQINLLILLSKENIKVHNLITITQISAIFISLVFFFYVLGEITIESYIYSMFIGYSITFLVSIPVKYLKQKNNNKESSFQKIIGQILKYGFYVQFASLSQLFNYRLSYYIIESYFGKSLLGVFDVAIKISEGIWLPAKSISMVQYSRISNSDNDEYSKQLTLNFLKFIFASTLLLTFILILIPSSLYELIKPEFGEVATVILYLSPGILFLAIKMIMVHYFSGTGRHYYNTISSVIGLVTTAICGFTLIPKLGLIGGAITASASYISSFIFQFITFIFVTKVKFSDFLISKNDYKYLKNEIKKTFKKQ